MPRHDPRILDNPIDTCNALFWGCVLDDIHGQGVTSDNLPAPLRRLPYAARVIIEREQLRLRALEYLDSDGFVLDALRFNYDPRSLRLALLKKDMSLVRPFAEETHANG